MVFAGANTDVNLCGRTAMRTSSCLTPRIVFSFHLAAGPACNKADVTKVCNNVNLNLDLGLPGTRPTT